MAARSASEAGSFVGIESSKDGNYYRFVRQEIKVLLPANATRIIDVGCGEGHTAAWLKRIYPGAWIIGIEGFAENETVLRGNVDEAIIADLNNKIPDIGSPDLALFLDVLEHLPRPEAVLSEVVARMPTGGKVIVSVPNVANLAVAGKLFWLGQFEYRDAGILDRTHMRFFVRNSAIELLESAGLSVCGGIYTGFWSRRYRWLNSLSGGLLTNRLATQIVLLGEKTPAISRRKFKWTTY